MRRIMRVMTVCLVFSAVGLIAILLMNRPEAAAPIVPFMPIETDAFEVMTPGNVQYLSEVMRLPYDDWGIGDIKYSPDGRLLAVYASTRDRIPDTEQHKVIDVWDIYQRQRLYRFETESFGIPDALLFSPDGRYIVLQGASEYTEVWDLQTQKKIDALSEYQLIAFSPTGQIFLYTDDEPHQVEIYDRIGGTLVKEWTLDAKKYYGSLAYSPDGKYFTASWDGLHVWETDTWQEILRLEGHRIKFSRDGRFLAVAVNTMVEVWDLEKHQKIQTFPSIDDVPYFEFGPDGKQLTIQNHNTYPMAPGKTYDIKTGEIVFDWIEPQFPLYTPNGELMISRFHIDGLQIWDAKNLAYLRNLEISAFGGRHSDLEISPDGRTFANTRFDTEVRIWAVDRTSLRCPIHTGPDDPLNSTVLSSSNVSEIRMLQRFYTQGDYGYMTFSPDGRYLAAGGTEWFYVWNFETGQTIRRVPNLGRGYKTQIMFDETGQTFFVKKDDQIWAWDMTTGQSVDVQNPPNFKDPDTSHDGSMRVEFSEEYEKLGIWHEETKFDVLTSPYLLWNYDDMSPAFSPDDRLLVTDTSQSGPTQIVFWETGGGWHVYNFFLHEDVYDMAFSPDGRYLVTSAGTGADWMTGTIRVWGICEP